PACVGRSLLPIVVFVPLVFLGGIPAVFFRALAATLVTAVLASLLLAILLPPTLARLFFKRRTAEPNAVEVNSTEAEQAGEGRLMRWLTARYEWALQWSLRHARLILLASLAVVAGSALIFF